MVGTPKRLGVLGLACVALSGLGGCSAKEATPKVAAVTTTSAPKELSGKQVFELAAPATIQLYGRRGSSFSGGTGVIYDKAKGYAITNAHVVEGLATLKARYSDGTESTARVRGIAPCSDLAVIELTEKNEKAGALPLGDSSTVRTADHVSVLGYPASFQDFTNSKVVFTEGSVQAAGVKAENIAADLPSYPDTIQHSATINHGNSGGPLVDSMGKLVGINTLTNFGGEKQVQGQFYSISINKVKAQLPDLEAGKSTNNIGWSLAPLSQASMSVLIPALGLGDQALGLAADEALKQQGIQGLVVLSAEAGSAAATANLELGDIVRTMQRAPVSTISQVCDILNTAGPGATIGLEGNWTVNGGADHKFADAWTQDLKVPA